METYEKGSGRKVSHVSQEATDTCLNAVTVVSTYAVSPR